jgi:hypothetical protein
MQRSEEDVNIFIPTDIQKYLEQFSEIMFDWLKYWAYYKRNASQFTHLSKHFEFSALAKLLNFTGNSVAYLTQLRAKANIFYAETRVVLNNPSIEVLDGIEADMQTYGITRKNVYLYLRGHSVYAENGANKTDGFILKFTEKIISDTIDDTINKMISNKFTSERISRYRATFNRQNQNANSADPKVNTCFTFGSAFS